MTGEFHRFSRQNLKQMAVSSLVLAIAFSLLQQERAYAAKPVPKKLDARVLRTMDEIKSLKIQGARNIALAALNTLKQVAQEKGFGRDYLRAAKGLLSTRPTAVPLHNVIQAALQLYGPKKEDAKTRIDSLNSLAKSLEESYAKATQNGAKLIKNKDVILTHCHSSEVIGSMIAARKRGVDFKVIVTETRPKMQGVKTARELLQAGIPVDYVVDSAAGYCLREMKVTKVLVGIDAIRKEGVYNKIGTEPIACAARNQKVPVYCIGDSFKIDRRPEIEIEKRSPDEIISANELPGARIINLAFDCTPWKMIDKVVTEKGMHKSWRELISRRNGIAAAASVQPVITWSRSGHPR